jgi:hypothetical protein
MQLLAHTYAHDSLPYRHRLTASRLPVYQLLEGRFTSNGDKKSTRTTRRQNEGPQGLLGDLSWARPLQGGGSSRTSRPSPAAMVGAR